MDRRLFLQTFAAASMMQAQNNARKPNIIFILMDDLGWADLSCYGSRFHQTPHLDRFASQGMRFTEAYAACPVCSPTRASIMTGRYPGRLQLTNFIPGRSPRPFAKLVPPEFQQQLPLAENTLAERLKAQGYATAHIGKWHLGGTGFTPDLQGFDLSFSTGGRHLAGTWTVQHPHQPRPEEDRADRLTLEAERFIEANRARPFFLYLAHHLPHIPLEARSEISARYEKKQPSNGQYHPVYAAMLETFDSLIGRLLKKIDNTGLIGNTVVIFTSDNGGLTAPEFANKPTTSNRPLREGKGHLYEGGIRVPLLVRWPGVTKPGSTTSEPTSTVDWVPTLTGEGGTDGKSILPLLRGSAPSKPRPLFWHYPHYSNQGGEPGAAVRLGDHKLIRFYADDRKELYNLREDPGEKSDLSAQLPARTKELAALLNSWLSDIGAAMPTANPNHDPRRETEGLRWVPRSNG
ncbi:MAG TPA: sulfatase [Bryobacteraceae bacterium]|nr:sulfatase [Bryobacteraceae bacterium]